MNPISPCSAEETSRVRPSTEGGAPPTPPSPTPPAAPQPQPHAGPRPAPPARRWGPAPPHAAGEAAAGPAPPHLAGKAPLVPGPRRSEPPEVSARRPPPPIGRRSRAGRGAGPGRAEPSRLSGAGPRPPRLLGAAGGAAVSAPRVAAERRPLNASGGGADTGVLPFRLLPVLSVCMPVPSPRQAHPHVKHDPSSGVMRPGVKHKPRREGSQKGLTRRVSLIVLCLS